MRNVVARASGVLLFCLAGAASAEDIDITPDYTPQERTDFERALEAPAPEPYVPNALETLERGNIPTYENPLPPSDGIGVTIDNNGTPQGTYTTDF